MCHFPVNENYSHHPSHHHNLGHTWLPSYTGPLPKMDEVGLQIHVCTIGLRKVSSCTLNVLKAVEVPLGKTPNSASE